MSKRIFIGYEDYKVKLRSIKLNFAHTDFIMFPYPNLKDFNLATDGIKCWIKSSDKPCLEGSKVAFDHGTLPNSILLNKFIKCDKDKDADIVLTWEKLGYVTIRAVVLINENDKHITITNKSYEHMTTSKVLFDGTLAVFFCTKQHFFRILSLAKQGNTYDASDFFKNLSNSGFDLTESEVNTIFEMLNSEDEEIIATGISLVMTSNYVKYRKTIYYLLSPLNKFYSHSNYNYSSNPICELVNCGFFIRYLIQGLYGLKTSDLEKEDLELFDKCLEPESKLILDYCYD